MTKKLYYEIKGEELFRDGLRICFAYRLIEKIVVLSDEIYVFEVPGEKGPSRKVYCLNLEGKEKWILMDASLEAIAGNAAVMTPEIVYGEQPPELTVRVVNDLNVFCKGRCIFTAVKLVEWLMYLDQRIYILTTEYGTGRNVYCVSEEGNLLWQIPPAVGPVDPSGHSFYTSLFCLRGEPWAGTFSGFDSRLDPKTGKIVEEIFTK
ncbi:MAG: hypothetical protein HY877_04565 [Deltaproteobacteria bacterium]|nr:hypothetical protein [Deltaproteobacteria bacterium]